MFFLSSCQLVPSSSHIEGFDGLYLLHEFYQHSTNTITLNCLLSDHSKDIEYDFPIQCYYVTRDYIFAASKQCQVALFFLLRISINRKFRVKLNGVRDSVGGSFHKNIYYSTLEILRIT